MNSFIPWVGGKSKLLWIINKMAPDHYSRFIDVFGGSGTVTMSRPIQPGCMEVYNDFNSNLTNLFCCVKNRPLKLRSLMRASMTSMSMTSMRIRSRFRFPSRRLGMQDFWARICTSRSSTVPWSLQRIRMMSKDHEYLYPYSSQEAKKRNQLSMWRESYHVNVACRNAIEETIRQNFDGMHLKKDCLEPVLAEYGYKRTEWVLATTLQELSWDGRFSRANKQWAARRYIPQDERHNAEITVRSHPAILDGFVDLYREARVTM